MKPPGKKEQMGGETILPANEGSLSRTGVPSDWEMMKKRQGKDSDLPTGFAKRDVWGQLNYRYVRALRKGWEEQDEEKLLLTAQVSPRVAPYRAWVLLLCLHNKTIPIKYFYLPFSQLPQNNSIFPYKLFSGLPCFLSIFYHDYHILIMLKISQ